MTLPAEAALAEGALKFLAPFAASIAIAAGGFAAAEVYEHKVPWGLASQLTHHKAAEAAWAATAKRNADGAVWWAGQYHVTEAAREADRNRAADSVTDTSNARQAASGDAYDSGYRSGLMANVIACTKGDDHDQSTPPTGAPAAGGGPADPAGGLPDDGWGWAPYTAPR